MVAALRSDRGASRRWLLAALDRRFTLLLSVPLLLEYEVVLARPEQLQASGFTLGDLGVILDTLVSVAEPVALHFHWRPAVKDAADEMVLETAVNGRADLLLTFNQRDLQPAARLWRVPVDQPGPAWVVYSSQHGAFDEEE